MVNFGLVLKTLSFLLAGVATFMLVPAGMAVYQSHYAVATAFIIPIAAMYLFGICMKLFMSGDGAQEFSTRDGFLFVSAGWLAAAFFGALPFFISGYIPSLADAFFESMSGFTTTGATILADIEAIPPSLLFWRAMTHWLGGMGIVVLLVAVLRFFGVGGLFLVRAEAPGPSLDRVTPRISDTAKILWMAYVVLTFAEVLLLFAGGMSLFDSFTHSFATMATGGFSTHSASLGYYDSPYIHIVVTVFMLLAGINFLLYFKLITGKPQDIIKNSELKAYILIFVIAVGLIARNLYGNVFSTAGESLRYASFQAASILTTTGFSTADYEVWPFFSKAVLFTLMFIGGSAGSTGGGIKVVRILALFKLGFNEMKMLIHPRGIFRVKINGSNAREAFLYSVAAFFFLYLAVMLVVTLVVASGGNSILTSISSSLATLGNIGPGFGGVGPALNYAFYPDYIKWTLSFAMMVGRLELFTVLVLFTPLFWKH